MDGIEGETTTKTLIILRNIGKNPLLFAIVPQSSSAILRNFSMISPPALKNPVISALKP